MTIQAQPARLIPDGPGGAAWNMAVDETLLVFASTPVLRFYRWKEDCWSLGYSQSWRELPEGCLFVRRLTGGGSVRHGRDLTYSLVVPRGFAFASLSPRESYRRIHGALREAFLAVNVEASMADTAGVRPSARCFESWVPYDLVYRGKKIAGGAQRRSRKGLLHQGSILLLEDLDDKGLLHFFAQRLALELGVEWEEAQLSGREKVSAEALERSRYATTDWNRRW